MDTEERTAPAVARIEEAAALLEEAGFSEEAIIAVLKGAARNRIDPVRYATRAVLLRRHVDAGLPLAGSPLDELA